MIVGYEEVFVPVVNAVMGWRTSASRISRGCIIRMALSVPNGVPTAREMEIASLNANL